MSEQLDELIKLLEAQAAEERDQIERQPSASRNAQRRHQGQLNRIRQRLDALESLRAAEVHREAPGLIQPKAPAGDVTTN